MFLKNGVSKHFSIFTGKHLCRSLFLIKLQVWRPASLLKRDRCFPMKFAKFFWNTFFLQNTSGGCFWLLDFGELDLQVVPWLNPSWVIFVFCFRNSSNDQIILSLFRQNTIFLRVSQKLWCRTDCYYFLKYILEKLITTLLLELYSNFISR